MPHPDPQSALACYPVADRRRDPRYVVQVPIEIRVRGCDTALSTETTDLSRHGCYVRLRNPLPAGLWILAILWINAVPVRIEGRIVTRHPEFGNGIMFLNMREGAEKALAAYLEALAGESAF